MDFSRKVLESLDAAKFFSDLKEKFQKIDNLRSELANSKYNGGNVQVSCETL